MKTPQNAAYEYVSADVFNAAWTQEQNNLDLLASSISGPGLVNPFATSYVFSGLEITSSLPAPFAVQFSGGALAGAHGVINNADTQSYTTDFTSLVPVSGVAVTAYLIASAVQIQQNPYQVLGPPPGHPDYNPNFQPYTAYGTIVDSLALTASLTPPDNLATFALLSTVLTSGQAAITAASFAPQWLARTPDIENFQYYSSNVTLVGANASVFNVATAPMIFTLPPASAVMGQVYSFGSLTSGAVSIQAQGMDLLLGAPNSFNTSQISSTIVQNNAVTPNTKIDISGANGTFTIDTTTGHGTPAVNGMDGEAPPSTGWIYIYQISNGATTAGIASTSQAGPSLPTGYSSWQYLGAMYFSSNALLAQIIRGNRAQYVRTPGGALPFLTPGVGGDMNASEIFSMSAISLVGFVPPGATSIQGGGATVGATNGTAVAPNVNYIGAIHDSNAFFFITPSNSVGIGAYFDFEIENPASPSIGYASADSSALLYILGWTDGVSGATGGASAGLSATSLSFGQSVSMRSDGTHWWVESAGQGGVVAAAGGGGSGITGIWKPGIPSLSAFTQRNIGASSPEIDVTFSENPGVAITALIPDFTSQPTAIAALVIAAPAAPYELVASVSNIGTQIVSGAPGWGDVGVAFTDGAGAYLALDVNEQNLIAEVDHFTSETSGPTSLAAATVYFASGSVYYLHLKNDGTTVFFGISVDGATPSWFYQETISGGHLTSYSHLAFVFGAISDEWASPAGQGAQNATFWLWDTTGTRLPGPPGWKWS